ncbi:hypothetical protein MJO29_002036 [Puccinia striiformis f. sp. tritici]|nr:hypothetical protein MJO29_002036 [Puccinia striiformis f. sp. tritici]
MAQAALARIKKLEKQKANTIKPTTTTVPASSSSSPQSTSDSTSTQIITTEHNHLSENNKTETPSSTSELQQEIKTLKDQIESINKSVSTYKDVVETQTNLIDSIKSSLSCNICLEVLDSPYALLCGHIFCHRDLYAWFHRTNPGDDQYDSDTHDSDDDESDSEEDEDRRAGYRHQFAGEHDHRLDPMTDSSDDSSDSETVQTELNRNGPANRGGADATNRPQEPNLVGLMNESQLGQSPNRTTLRPISAHRRRKNLICPQCRAPVIRRPMALYAVKEATDKLKATGTPTPSSSCPTGSFRNLVEQQRDEKDLTWGQLFDSDTTRDNRLVNNVRADSAERRHVVVDHEDGVRRCGQCTWEIGTDGICEGCQARYSTSDIETDVETEEDSNGFYSDSTDMGTIYEEDGAEGEEEEEGAEQGSVASEDEEWRDRPVLNFWRRPIGRALPEDSSDDDNDDDDDDRGSMVRMVSAIGDSEDESSSDIQVYRARRRIVRDDSDIEEVQPNPAARRRAAAQAEPPRRRPSPPRSSPRSDRPNYAPSNNRDDDEEEDSPAPRRRIFRAGIATRGRVISSSNGGYSSNQSEHGTPTRHPPHKNQPHRHTHQRSASNSTIDSNSSDDEDPASRNQISFADMKTDSDESESLPDTDLGNSDLENRNDSGSDNDRQKSSSRGSDDDDHRNRSDSDLEELEQHRVADFDSQSEAESGSDSDGYY